MNKKFVPLTSMLLLAFIILTGCANPQKIANTVHIGMTKQQVLAIAGKPQAREDLSLSTTGIDSPNLPDEMWTYHNAARHLIPGVDIATGYKTDLTNIYFKNGKVMKIGEATSSLW